MTAEDIHYQFSFENGGRWSHRIPILQSDDAEDRSADTEPGDWTRLGNHQCEHCPLSVSHHARCPFAVALQPVLDGLGSHESHETVAVRVETPQREVSGTTSLQRGMGSMLGVVGAFSGCPHLRILRPMARLHLPFSNAQETMVRVFGIYLAGQHLRQFHGLEADWEMHKLRESYRAIRKVNQGMSRRLREVASDDTANNSVVLLDLLASDVELALDEYEGELDVVLQEFLER
ncbi:hypothetical protein EZI54_19995 [Marinobacter halodurans]|uniref:Uncharacterized protein n=1 Tax=Marinobacter halodurans TaxID=2528979 RepID=A0ABY1ZHV9_9GAMM|nr:hypothetical protein [Marinobacter halodurans]TBW49230.1 hypothetical protein EZI54_19995 [Marinobacter halodurans]